MIPQPKIPFQTALLYSPFLFLGDEPGARFHEKLGDNYFIHRDAPGRPISIDTTGNENPEIIPYRQEQKPWETPLILK